MPVDRKELLARAEQALRGGDLKEAVSCYRQLLALTPNDLALMQRLGDALARLNQQTEARGVFCALADEYWRAGLGSRALAILRRAARLGPPDRELLAVLGRRLRDQGLAAEARGPLLEAARMGEAAGKSQIARDLYADVAAALPKDLSSREALVRLADADGSPAARAAARVELAAARGRSGEAHEAFALFGEALQIDPEALTALRGLPDLRDALAETDAGGAPPPPDLPETARVGWTLLCAVIAHARTGRFDDVDGLENLLAPASGAAPRVRLWAAWALVEQGRVARAAPALLALARAHASDVNLQAELSVAGAALRRRAPGAPECEQMQVVLAGPQTPPESRGQIVEAPVVPSAPVKPATAEWEALASTDAQAKLVEAEAFVARGLLDQARRAVAAIPAALHTHERVAAVIRRLPAAAAQAKAAAPHEDDEFLTIMLDEDDDLTGAVAQPAQVARAEATPPPAPPAVHRIDVGGLEASIRDSVDPADAEMSYQIAVGLLEMGLTDQAAPLLERVLRDRTRRVHAALLLAKLRAGRGEHEQAYAECRTVLGLAVDAPPPVRAELLAVVADLALHTGRTDDARRFTEELQALLPTHPGLPDLLAQRTASKT